MGISIAQTMTKAGIWAIYSWKPEFRKPTRCTMFANRTKYFFSPRNEKDKDQFNS